MLFVNSQEKQKLKFPSTVEDLRELNSFLSQYRDHHFYAVLAGFCAVYILYDNLVWFGLVCFLCWQLMIIYGYYRHGCSLQTFAIPGAIFLSILAGPLFGFWLGLLIVSTVYRWIRLKCCAAAIFCTLYFERSFGTILTFSSLILVSGGNYWRFHVLFALFLSWSRTCSTRVSSNVAEISQHGSLQWFFLAFFFVDWFD